MLGQAVSMVLPQVVGYRLTGQLGQLTTSTDVVLTITKVSFHCGIDFSLSDSSCEIIIVIYILCLVSLCLLTPHAFSLHMFACRPRTWYVISYF